MFTTAYEITISLICFFIVGTLIGWFLQECWNTHNKIKEQEEKYVSWNVPDHVNCRCSIIYPQDETLEGDDDDK